MTNRQIVLVMQLVREQLDDYLAPQLANDIADRILAGIQDNRELFDQLKEEK